MTRPTDIAIVALGPGGAAVGRRLRAALPGARLYGPKRRIGDWDGAYADAVAEIARLFAAGTAVIGICASGILVRAVAPLLADKRDEPPVLAVAEDGSVVVPVLGGHHGGNELARRVAALLGGTAAITTAGDLRLGFALDEPPPGWRIADPGPAKAIMTALLASEKVALVEEAGGGEWLKTGTVEWVADAARRIVVTDRARPAADDTLVLHPPVLALGIGCARGAPLAEVATLARACLEEAGLAAAAVAAVVSVDLKLAEPAVHALAEALGAPARFFAAARLLHETPRLSERSEAAFGATGCWGVAEGAALAAVGPEGRLLVAKRKSAHATCAIAQSPQPLAAERLGRARGQLAIIGIGPGDPEWRTPEASALLAAASEVVGYRRYLDLLGPAIAGKTRHPSPIGDEAVRVGRALDLAAEGRKVALVSSGDAGVYGLASLVFETLDRAERPEWRAVAVRVAPGVTAMQAAAARAGAPLGHDFCAISLSDRLTPWPEIAARLEAAGAGDFVVALYNPSAAGRTRLLKQAAAILLRHRPPQTPVLVARNLGRDGEERRLIALSALAAATGIDMLSLVIIGSSRTRIAATEPPWLYTPRGYPDPGRR